MEIIIYCAIAAAGIAIGGIAGSAWRKNIAEKEIGSAEDEAKRIVNEAIKSAEAKKREAIVEAREEIHKNRIEEEKEIKERRAEVQKSERRVIQKEEALDKKQELMSQKEEALALKIREAEKNEEETQHIRKSQIEMLEKISGMSKENAKEYLIKTVEDEARHDAAVRLNNIERELKEECDQKARNIISLAIQRCAADHVAEATVSVVPLPNDDMKGRIIGREGRNIRTLETLTGVDLIIDDTPEAIAPCIGKAYRLRQDSSDKDRGNGRKGAPGGRGGY